MDFKKLAADQSETLIRKVLDVGIAGAGPFKGAEVVAEECLRHAGNDIDEAIRRSITLHTRLAGVEGFAAGLPGGIALAATIPTDVTAFYILAARMVASIAHLRGYRLNDDHVRSAILITLLGANANEVLKEFGIKVGTKGLGAATKKIPGALFIQINKRVGFRLITKAGETGLINVGKLVPLIGGPIGGGFNLVAIRRIASYAKKVLPTVPPSSGSTAPSHAVVTM